MNISIRHIVPNLYGVNLSWLCGLLGILDAPPKATLDAEILIWCQTNGFILVTNNRKSMPGHLANHLASGCHVPGIFTIDTNQSIGQTVEELITIAGT
ncbi:MAG: hypothetical protein V7K88_30795 [Nostoc sp.]|uniref:hypothetical protein n=1 Tax=Nostoc sp. TaxID=1180 RepID=UPI002FF92283